MDETFDLNITATPEQIAGAVMGGLLATVTTLYPLQMSTVTMGQSGTTVALAMSTGDIDKFKGPEQFVKEIPVVSRREYLTVAYDVVIKSLPIGSPFREPLEKRRNVKVAAMKE